MAALTLDDLLRVHPAYANLPSAARPENPSGQCPYRVYKFIEASKCSIYKFVARSDDEIISFHTKFIEPNFAGLTEDTFLEFIQMAMSLKAPTSGEPIFTAPWNGVGLCDDYLTAKPTLTGVIKMASVLSSSVQPIIIPATATPMGNAPAEDGKSKAQAISFLYAWLTRFIVKQPSAALGLQYDKVRETYLKLYKASSAVFEFRPSAEWIKGIREAADSFIRVKNTLIVHVADAETRYKSDINVFNLLRYLYFQNLEFMGMHAYVSIVNITVKLALSPAQVLTWLRINGAELAIDEAYNIMATLDNGLINNGHKKERLWKYARCIDQGYFNRLQTTYITELMAMLAWIEIKLGLAPETGYSSPLNIYAIANNPHICEVGKMKAEAFMMKAYRNTNI